MLLEHIARGRYILNMDDKQANDIKLIAIAFYHGNKSRCIAHILIAGIEVYNEMIKQGEAHDHQFKDSLAILAEGLCTNTNPKEHDISCPHHIGEVIDGQLKDCTCKERKCGSAIQSGD